MTADSRLCNAMLGPQGLDLDRLHTLGLTTAYSW